jgi:hypothetical protein
VPLNAWPIDEIIQNQSEDPVLSEVRQWLQAGTRPDGNTISADFDTQAYLRQYNSLILRDNLVYRVFLDVRGNVKHNQLLQPTRVGFLPWQKVFLPGQWKKLVKTGKNRQKPAKTGKYWKTRSTLLVLGLQLFLAVQKG